VRRAVQAGPEPSDTGCVESRRTPPIYSLLVDDEGLARLDAFVVALGERIDSIQENEQLGQPEEAAKRAAELAADAVTMGLPPLAEAAERVVASCLAADAQRLHDAVVELTEVATRVRLGHRGGIH
jgi:hypothetical protein